MGTDKSLIPIDDDAQKRGLQLIGDVKSGLDPLQILEKQEHEEIVQTIQEAVGKLAVFHLHYFISLVKVERISVSNEPGPINPFSGKVPKGLAPVLRVTLLPIWISDFVDAYEFAGGKQPSPWLVESGFSDVPRSTEYASGYLSKLPGEAQFLSDLVHAFVHATQVNKPLDWLPNRCGKYNLASDSLKLTSALSQGLILHPHRVALFQACIETLPSGFGWRRTREELHKRGVSYVLDSPSFAEKEISSIDIENWRL